MTQTRTPTNREAGGQPTLLIVRDGWGENPHREHDAFNAVRLADTPVADALMRRWPTTLIKTCGTDVGLPAGTMGNSEVGHQNIGAGRIVPQELMRIDQAIERGDLARNATIKSAFAHVRRTGGAVHLLGLVSHGRVHSDLPHAIALLEIIAAQVDPERIFIHAITDGRDTGPFTGAGYVERLEEATRRIGAGRIATVIGRFWAMDRDHRWARVARAFAALTGRTDVAENESVLFRSSASEAIEWAYANPPDDRRKGDEFILPTIIGDPATGRIGSGDAVIFFNYRGDRPREITRAFVLDDEAWKNVKNGGFERGERLEDLCFCTLANYEEGLPAHVILGRPAKMPDILGDVIARTGLTQFRCAETEKFPHVTFFFNDYREPPFPGESRELIPSPTDVATYDQKPEMSAIGVREAVLARLGAKDGEVAIIVNFANADMVGHTGNLEAAVQAVETVDESVGRLVEATLERGGSAIITADHGNAEQMWNPETEAAHTAHTTYDVPLIVASPGLEGAALREGGRLADIAPTFLELMGLDQPEAMTGRSLLHP